jgi:hypothetical protein
MYLQGKIPVSAKTVAADLQISTVWQKYNVYNLLISLALEFQAQTFPLLPFEPADHDAHDLPNDVFDGEQSLAFRRKHRIKNGAQFFRYSMNEGSSLLHLYVSKELPPEITAANVLLVIRRLMGKHERFVVGLKHLEGFAK